MGRVSDQKGGNRRKVKPQALRAGGTLRTAAIIGIAVGIANTNAIISISIITVNNFLLDFVAPFPGRGSLCCGPRLPRAVPRPGQPPAEGALGSGRAEKIDPEKLILVAFVI